MYVGSLSNFDHSVKSNFYLCKTMPPKKSPAKAKEPAAQEAKKEVRKQTALQKNYLIAYNLASCIGWFAVLVLVVQELQTAGYQSVYGKVSTLLNIVQTCALFEVNNLNSGISFNHWFSKSRSNPNRHSSFFKIIASLVHFGKI